MIFDGIFLLHQLSVHFVYFRQESQKNQDKEGQNGAGSTGQMRCDLHIDAWGAENKNREDIANETKQRENRHRHPLRTQFFNVFPRKEKQGNCEKLPKKRSLKMPRNISKDAVTIN